MNIIAMIGVLAISTSIVINFYKLMTDIDICYKCPYSNSVHCYTCRRESSIRSNKYNKLKT